MSERTIRILVPILFVFYFLMGFGRWISGEREIYPFGVWDMYYQLPTCYRRFDLRIHRLQGQDFSPPLKASRADSDLGIFLDGHRQLVLNAYVQNLEGGQADRAAIYRDFVSTSIIGPDSVYDILHTRARVRRNQRALEETIAHGPFVTPIGAPPRSANARIQFFESGRFKPQPFNTDELAASKKLGGCTWQ